MNDFHPFGTIEENVLSLLMYQPQDFDQAIAAGLTEVAFPTPRLRDIFRAMCKLADGGERPEPGNLLLHLPQDYATTIATLLNQGPVTLNTLAFVNKLLESHWREKAQQKFSEVQAKIKSGQSVDSLSADVASLSEQLTREAPEQEKPDAFRAVLDETLQGIEQKIIRRREGGTTGITTGIKKLDAEIQGFEAGNVYFVGGRPGMGKSTLAVNLAVSAARAGHRTVYFTTEMPRTQIANRALGLLSLVDSKRLNHGDLTETELDRVAGATRLFHDLPLHIDDVSSYRLSGILRKTKSLKRVHGLKMVIIDYMQDVVDDRQKWSGNRQQELTTINRELKAMAKALQVAVVGVVMVGREADKVDRPGLPRLSDIKESGSFEQVADVVLFVHREAYYQNGTRDVISIAKNRHGEMNKLIDLRINLVTGYMGD